LSEERISSLRTAIQNAESSHMSRGSLKKLKHMVKTLEKDSVTAKNPADSARLHALAEILKHPSA